jgi:flagellar basal body-associated protein FliL
MADEEQVDVEQTQQSSAWIWKAIIIVVVVLVPAVAGFVTFKMVVEPMTVVETPVEPEEPEDKIPLTAQTVSFEETFATVIMPDPNIPASLLLFRVSLECANPETAVLVTAHQARFSNMLTQLHSFRTREELNDPLVKESIQKQALQKANDILRRLQETFNPNIRITGVFHDRFAIQDQ